MVKCPKCGEAEIVETDTCCPTCGYELFKSDIESSTHSEDKTSSAFESKPSATSESKSYNKIIVVVAVIVIIAVVGVLASGMFSNNNSSDDASVNDDGGSVKNVEDDSSSSNDDSSIEYWASAKADKFHLPDCEWAEKISDDNKIIYDSRDDAIADGKEPCDVCNP